MAHELAYVVTCKQYWRTVGSWTILNLFSFSLQVTAELFNILSGQTDVDHPLCEV